MEAPKCRLCGKRHYGLCEFGEGESSSSVGNARGSAHSSRSDGPLTNAEREVAKSGRRENSRSTSAAPVDSSSKDSPDRSSADTVDTRGDADAKKPRTRNVPPVDTSTSDGRTTPLTNAERQKRYRERHGDEYREKNRERMRENRRRSD